MLCSFYLNTMQLSYYDGRRDTDAKGCLAVTASRLSEPQGILLAALLLLATKYDSFVEIPQNASEKDIYLLVPMPIAVISTHFRNEVGSWLTYGIDVDIESTRCVECAAYIETLWPTILPRILGPFQLRVIGESRKQLLETFQKQWKLLEAALTGTSSDNTKINQAAERLRLYDSRGYTFLEATNEILATVQLLVELVYDELALPLGGHQKVLYREIATTLSIPDI